MNKKYILTGIIILIICGLAYVVWQNKSENLSIQKSPAHTATYMCNNNQKITAGFYDGNNQTQSEPNTPPIPTGSVTLTFGDGSTIALNQTLSADGGRYANTDESFIFWSKGNGAMVLQNNVEKDYTGCIIVAEDSASQNLPQIYANAQNGFSIRLPENYTVDTTYTYQITPKKIFNGVKFTIPPETATGTNLASDTYLSVETAPQATTCAADMFLDDSNIKATNITDNGTQYSVASSTGAGAGNRYEETIYAIPGTSPCRAIRYFIHYGVFENYPTGTISKFDEQALTNQFDTIRRTLVLD